MTPTAPELMTGVAVALSAQAQEGDAGAFTIGKLGLAVVVSQLAAQDCAFGPAARHFESTAIAELLGEQAGRYGQNLAAPVDEGDHSLAALDAANAELRRRLIRLHAAAEEAGDRALDRRILALYREMARRRELHLTPPGAAPA